MTGETFGEQARQRVTAGSPDDHTVVMRRSPTSSSRRRLASSLAAGTLVLAACGGSSDDGAGAAGSGEPLPAATDGGVTDGDTPPEPVDAEPDVSSSSAADSAESGSSDQEPTETASPDAEPMAAAGGPVDLVGPDVEASAEVDTNQLPDVVVDDLNNGRKVNFRNLVPQEKPILLWMWAPH